MSENTTKEQEQTTEKPGFFARIFTKIDTAMKEKADQQEGCCCCDSETEKNDSTESCCEFDEDKKTDEKCC